MARRGDNIHKRKDGRWEGRYKNGYNANGSIKYRSIYAKSYSDCKKKLLSAQLNIERTIKRSSEAPLFCDVLYAWINANRIRIKGATVAKYTQMIESHIIPKLGGIKVNQLNSEIINSFLDFELKSGKLKTKEPLSPSYVRVMAIIIEATINYAVKEGICLPLNNRINKPSIKKNDVIILDRQSETILTKKIVNNSSYVSTGILLALQGGLRIGEVCALRWCDIDFNENIIHIRQTISRILDSKDANKTKLIIDTPKTVSSIRDVPMTSSLKLSLLKIYEYRCSEFVITNSNTFISPRTFDYQYKKLLKENKIPIFNFHTLRHTYATRCAESGMDAKTLSVLLGHSSPNTSLKLYVHPSLELAKKQLEAIFYTV